MNTPDHHITVTPATARWRARYDGHVIADTADALILEEAGHGPVVYFPRDDIEMGYFGPGERRSHCPAKGDARYFTLRLHSDIEEDAAWSYEDPLPAAAAIAGRIAFHADHIEVYPVDEDAVDPHHRHGVPGARASIDEIVQHTDAGAGEPQGERWAPTVEMPDPERSRDGGLP